MWKRKWRENAMLSTWVPGSLLALSFNPNKNFTLRGIHYYLHFTNKDSETREAETSPGHTSEEGGRQISNPPLTDSKGCALSSLPCWWKYFWKDMLIAFILPHPVQKFMLTIYFSNYVYTMLLILVIKYIVK